MCSKHLGADFVYAWPKAEIAVMGAEGALEILYAKEMKDPAQAQLVAQKSQEHRLPKFRLSQLSLLKKFQICDIMDLMAY